MTASKSVPVGEVLDAENCLFNLNISVIDHNEAKADKSCIHSLAYIKRLSCHVVFKWCVLQLNNNNLNTVCKYYNECLHADCTDNYQGSAYYINLTMQKNCIYMRFEFIAACKH